jgi:hypothetical protein
MEPKQKSIGANALTYGAITAAAMIVYSLILFILNLYLNKPLGYVNYLLLIAGMVLGTLNFRKLNDRGLLPYGKAFTSCFLIGLIASVISIIYFFIYMKFINTGMINEMLEQARQEMMTKNLSEEQMDKAMEYTAKFMQPAWMMVFGLLMYVIVSVILSAIIAIFLKKEDKSDIIA